MTRLWVGTVLLGCGTGLGLAQTTEELVNDGKNTDNVTTQSMGYDRKSYSPLKQINKSNIKRLVPIWSTSLMNDQGELAAPTVYNGVMYVVNGKWTFAIDVETGSQIWRTPVELEAGITRSAFNRGAATIYNGKLFRVTVDNHVLALDMKTGKEIWNQKFADMETAITPPAAPIIANGVLISGVSGGESTTRGFLDGWDPNTGKKLWRRYTIPAPGEPGSETWPKNTDAWIAGRRSDVALRLLRSATRSGLLGNRKRRAVRSATSRGFGQLVYQQRARDPAENRRGGLLFSIHAQRRIRCGRHRRESARRYPDRRPASESDDPDQQERLPVRAGPDQLQTDRRASLRQSQLGDGYRPGYRPAGVDRSTTSAFSPAKRSKSGRRAARTRCPSRSIRTRA